ncbi:MAG TPA: hypothetical protein VGR38_08805 [Candidatus Polarisedimenticolia bacterium]|nr:hypothetical protein [Candidatus Polarisedimenticolia bacterium]
MSSAEASEFRPSRWNRLFFFLIAACAASAALQPVRSYDLGWHLATGRLMVSEGGIPRTDPFSFTRSGTPWLDHEWLFQIPAYLGYAAAGWKALALGTLFLSVAAYLLLALCARSRAGDTDGVTVLLALSLAGARFRFDPRPEMVSYLFLAALCFLLEWSRRRGTAASASPLFAVFALWANFHPAALLGAAVLVAWVAGESIQDRLAGRRSTFSPARTWVALLSPMAMMLNPGGWRILLVPLELHRIIASGHAPNLEWARPTYAEFPLLYGSAILGLALVLSGPKRIDWPPTLAASVAGVLAFQQLRNIGFFFLLLPLALARPLADRIRAGKLPRLVMRVLGGASLMALAILFASEAPALNRRSYLDPVAPEGAVRFLDRYQVGKRLFNDVKFGGYLIWRRYPEHPVFIDGRNEVYDSLLAEIFHALGSWKGWEEMLARYEIDAAMLRRGQLQAVEYPPVSSGSPPRKEMRAFSAAYFQSSRWALVYWDDHAVIFVRRDDPSYRGLLELEYRVVNPDDSNHLLEEIRHGRADRTAALRELDRNLRGNPGCWSARLLRDQIAALEATSGS